MRFRLTYFAKRETNRIDVLPVDFRSAPSAGQSPAGVGVPTNAGELRARGAELWASDGAWTLNAGTIRAFFERVAVRLQRSQRAAIAAGHLFPVGYVPDLTVTLSYTAGVAKRLRVTPSLSYQSRLPIRERAAAWAFDASGKPVQIPNDDHVNPGFNYYFLRDASRPYDPVANPIVASLGTPEGADPNTLRTTPQLLAGLHVENDLSRRATVILDVSNLFGTASPTQYQGNPYL